MVSRKVDEAATIWSIQRGLVIRFYHEWHIGDMPVVSCVAFGWDGVGYVKTMDHDGKDVIVK